VICALHDIKLQGFRLANAYMHLTYSCRELFRVCNNAKCRKKQLRNFWFRK